MEVHSEEIQVKGLNIKISVMLNITINKYTVVCKAFDKDHGLIWKTEILNDQGIPIIYNSLPEAIQKVKDLFIKKNEKIISPTVFPKD